MFIQKLYFEETYSQQDNLITWFYAAGVMCLPAIKYQGASTALHTAIWY